MLKSKNIGLLPVIRRNCRSLSRHSGMKKRLATIRFHLQKYPLPLIIICSLFSLIVFLLLPLSQFLVPNSVYVTAINDSNTSYIDPCLNLIAQPLIYFDPPLRQRISNRSTPYIFSAFFDKYLFAPTSDVVLSLNSTPSLIHKSDIETSLRLLSHHLPLFHSDPSLHLDNYTLGYTHLDRLQGSRHIFHTKSHNRTHKDIVHVISIQRTFEATCKISIRYLSEQYLKDLLYIVVPYSARPQRLTWFISQFDDLVSEEGIKAHLILAIFDKNETDVNFARNLISKTQSSNSITILPVPGDKTGFFSRAMAIRDASKQVPNSSIMFISDIDMYIFPLLFDTCRLNVIPRTQVYFPVFYTLFPTSDKIDKSGGYWRDSSLGMSCMTREDFDTVNVYGNDTDSVFIGWGTEDRVLHEAFMKSKQFEVFRAVDPALRHKWHIKHCELLTAAYEDCLAVTFQQLGDMKGVGKFMLDRGMDPQKMFVSFAEDDEDDPLGGGIVKGGGDVGKDSVEEQQRRKLLKKKNEERKLREKERERNREDTWRKKYGITLVQNEEELKEQLKEQRERLKGIGQEGALGAKKDDDIDNEEEKKELMKDKELLAREEDQGWKGVRKNMKAQWGRLLNETEKMKTNDEEDGMNKVR